MNLSRVKNYIILTLVVANSILAGLFAVRFFSEAAANRYAKEQLIGLLAKQGVIVSELPQETATALVLMRDLDAERAAAEAVLGEADMREPGKGVYQYQNEEGVAIFRGIGRFEIYFNSNETFSDASRGGVCRDLLSKMGFLNVSKSFDIENTPDGGALLTFWQSVDKNPLFNAKAVFEFSGDGRLLSASGTLALGAAQPVDRIECKSAGAVLLLLSANRDIEVESIALGYRMKPQTSESVRLVPEWRVLGGGSEFYLDGFTGAVVSAEE